MKKILSILLFCFFLSLLFLIFPKTTFASGTLYFSPASGIKYNGQNFIVSVRASGMDSVDGVKAVFTFPTDKLTFVSINSGGSDWGIKAQETVSGGTIELDRGNIGNLSGDKLVASITFRPRTNSGTANLSFTGDCALTLAGNNVLTGKNSASFTLADAPPPPPAPVADTTPPTISAITVTGLSVNTATISWTTNEASDSYVSYGESKDYFFSSGNGNLVTAHSVPLDSRFLKAGTNYHYMVFSKDGSGNQAKGSDQIFTTIGYDVILAVTDSTGRPLAKTKVTLHSTANSSVTDEKGRVTFKNVTAGEHVVVVESGGQELASVITVVNSPAKQIQTKDKAGATVTSFQTQPQKFNVKVASAATGIGLLKLGSLIAAGAGVVVLLGLAIFYFLRRHKSKALTK